MSNTFANILANVADKIAVQQVKDACADWECFKSVQKHGEKTKFQMIPGPRLIVTTPDGQWITRA